MTDTIQLQLTPLRAAVARDREITLDILATIRTPEIATEMPRPILNLAFVVDRSGSMAGRKLTYAKQALQYAIQQLRDRDRLSLTIFDNTVNVLVPSTPVHDPQGLCHLIGRITPGGSTALHQGWQVGADQAKAHHDPNALNRTILLSDGLANVGETNPDTIATHVSQREHQGISTTTIGVGLDYDEDLLSAMAASGNGNFYHIEDPSTIPSIFAAELQGLVATLGDHVRLAASSPFVIKDFLDDLSQDSQGNYRLLPLQRGRNTHLVFRLEIPACSQPTDVLTLTLSWQQEGEFHTLTQTLNLPVLAWADIEQLPADPLVSAHLELLNAARARAEAQAYLDRGKLEDARQVMGKVSASMKHARATINLENISYEDAESIDYEMKSDISQLDALSRLMDSMESLDEDMPEDTKKQLRKQMLSQRMRKQRGS